VELKPVRRIGLPAYPTRAELLAEKDLLMGNVPRRWRCGKKMAGAAAFLLAANVVGCTDAPSPQKSSLPVRPPTPATAKSQTASPKTPIVRTRTLAAAVAPLFEHGEGRGATGCIVMTPAVFLSEEEAMKVIREELGKSGIRLQRDKPLEDVVICDWNGCPVRPTTVVDGLDANSSVAVEFISKGDCIWLDPSVGGSTAMSFDTKGVARYVAHQIRDQGLRWYHVGVFYDPAPKWKSGRPFEESESLAKDLLRQQARDFVAWLQERGVI